MQTLSQVRQTTAASEHLFALLNAPSPQVEDGSEDDTPKGDIVFHDVDFHYAVRPDVSERIVRVGTSTYLTLIDARNFDALTRFKC